MLCLLTNDCLKRVWNGQKKKYQGTNNDLQNRSLSALIVSFLMIIILFVCNTIVLYFIFVHSSNFLKNIIMFISSHQDIPEILLKMALKCKELTAPTYGTYILGVVPSSVMLWTKRSWWCVTSQANQPVVIRNWLIITKY
jgi:hypothetical protein